MLNIKINKVVKLFCGPLDKIIVLDIECVHWYINNIENSFPIFNNKCPILKNLAYFRLKTYLVRYEVLNNIYNNIDYLPNLKYFELYCFTKDSIDIFYIKFIIKLLSLNIVEIYLRIKYEKQIVKIEGDAIDYEKWRKKFESENKEYSKKELKEFYPSINFNNYKNICIRKFR